MSCIECNLMFDTKVDAFKMPCFLILDSWVESNFMAGWLETSTRYAVLIERVKIPVAECVPYPTHVEFVYTSQAQSYLVQA